MTDNKIILDACCGGRMFWFDKHQKNTIYIDNSHRSKGTSALRPNFECAPDVVMDFRALTFADCTFKLVVWDPPHLFLGATSEMRKKYGSLDRATWKEDLKQGFSEIWRVLQSGGVLVFKWNEGSVPLKEILALFPQQPLFGHPTGSKSKTHWCVFMKITDDLT